MIDATPLNGQITRELKEEIMTGRLKPGERISIDDLAKKWKVSSTPIRDAIRSLESSGFVIVAPRKSVVVAVLDTKTFKNTFDLRIALECLALELAVNRIAESVIDDALAVTRLALKAYQETGNFEHLQKVDDIVHLVSIENCDNPKLVSMMDELNDLILWARRILIRQPKAYYEAALEHLQILDSIKKRDTQTSVILMRKHLANSFERTRFYWAENEDH